MRVLPPGQEQSPSCDTASEVFPSCRGIGRACTLPEEIALGGADQGSGVAFGYTESVALDVDGGNAFQLAHEQARRRSQFIGHRQFCYS